MSFKDISEGALPPLASGASSTPGSQESESLDDSRPPQLIIEMVICSFALHLVENSSQLFSLLWELSLKSRWLVVLAPHKKPEVSVSSNGSKGYKQ
jgi:cell division inhibitor SulA